MKKILILLIIIITVSCINNTVTSNNSQQQMTNLYEGNLYGNGVEGLQKENIVIKSKKDWNALLEKLDSENKTSDQFNKNIDFSKKYVLIAVDDVRNTGGYSIKINKIQEIKNILNVYVTTKSPKPTDMVATAIMQPIHIVLINKTDNNIVFVEK